MYPIPTASPITPPKTSGSIQPITKEKKKPGRKPKQIQPIRFEIRNEPITLVFK